MGILRSLSPIAATLEDLRAGRVTSRVLVEECLVAIADPAGEGSRTFLGVAGDAARSSAAGGQHGLLAGLPVSVKDLIDVAGERTMAASKVLADAPLAKADAVVVRRLRQAGAILIGRTNMTEFAFSGLGINPHYGTPKNPHDRESARIPGGSSSGAAVSVSDGMAYAAIGSDTGGSIRIPAALCGLTGFKPTTRRVSREGTHPLSTTLDSLGPIAPTVACCALIDAVLAGEDWKPLEVLPLAGLRFGVLQGFVLDGVEEPVARAFGSALTLLSALGAEVADVTFAGLDRIPEANSKGGFSAPEVYASQRRMIEERSAEYDPRVLARIVRGKEMTAVEYIELIRARESTIREARAAFAGYDAILLPTTPRIAPRIADVAATDEAYFDANVAMLRNPGVFNFLDGCALSVPCHRPGEAPVGLMIAGMAGDDRLIFTVGAAIERALGSAGRAIHGLA